MPDLTLAATAIAAILGITEVLKSIGLPGAYAPLAALVVGVGWVFLTAGISTAAIAYGIIYGLTASGLYSGGKTVGTAMGLGTPAPNSTG